MEGILKALLHETKHGLQSQKFDVNAIPHIELIEREIIKALSDSKGPIREMCMHILNAGGKRIRPMLALYSGLVFSKPTSYILSAAAAAELIHMASLIHDDIIDESAMRRNKPSINSVWGNRYAVLCGDYLFAKAFSILSHSRMISSLDYMVEAIQNMCDGEINQASDRFNSDLNVKSYYERIAKKTAILIKCCCMSGAAAAGADKRYILELGEYGLNIGYAFQIIDDIMDFCGNSTAMGKPKGEDFSQGIFTLPVLLMLENADYGNWIKETIEKRDFTQETISKISDVMQNMGIIGQAFAVAASHIDNAKQCLGQLPRSEHVQFLYKIANMLQARTN
jgi:heptaprenyl diphosphate synthase